MNGSIDTAAIGAIIILSTVVVELTKTVINRVKRNGNGSGSGACLSREEHDVLMGLSYGQNSVCDALKRIEAKLN